jgi:hypothetical protein
MRRLDWFLAAVIVVFLLASLAAQGLSRAMVEVAAGAPSTRESFMQRLVSPHGDPISVQCPTLLRRRLMDDPGEVRRC